LKLIKKYRLSRTILLFSGVVLLFLQSCVEIVEEVTVNNDRSGRVVLSLNIGKENGLFGLISQFADLSFMDEIEDEVGKTIYVLKQQKGISNVVFEKGRKMKLSFDFDNHKNLNKALYAVTGNEKTIFNPAIYKVRKNSFVKKNMTTWAKLMMEANKDEMPDDIVFDMVEITTIVHLPNPAKGFSGKGIQVSKDKLTLKSSNFVSDILEENISTKMKVRF
jgi:hypothetical protein